MSLTNEQRANIVAYHLQEQDVAPYIAPMKAFIAKVEGLIRQEP